MVGVWHRRPSEFATADPVDAAELRAGIGGILAALPYLNHPADMAVAAFKPAPAAEKAEGEVAPVAEVPVEAPKKKSRKAKTE